MTIVDDRKQAINEGDKVIVTAYGGRVPRIIAGEDGRVVGFTRRNQVKIQFFFEVYDDVFPYRSIPPEYLRVLSES